MSRTYVQGYGFEIVHPHHKTSKQYIVFPTHDLMFERATTSAHPRRHWTRTAEYAPEKSMKLVLHRSVYHARIDGSGHVVNGDPIGIQATTEEIAEMRLTHTLPRNVQLRFQRSMRALGRDEPWNKTYEHLATTETRRLTQDSPETWGEALDNVTGSWNDIIANRSIREIIARTPYPARVRGGTTLFHAEKDKIDSSPAPEPVAPAVPKPEPKPEIGTVSIGDRCIRPNGAPYIARAFHDNLSDIEAYRRARRTGLPILLYGAPGTGKTAGLEIAFQDVHTILGTSDTDISDFVGGYVPQPDGGYLWIDGPLVTAMESGAVLIVDEIGLIDPKVLSVLYSVMDGRGALNVTANPARGTVTATEGFLVVAATNPNAPGVRISEALLSRFPLQAEVGTDYKAMRALGADERMITSAHNLAIKRTAGETSWAPEAREILDFQRMINAFDVKLALRNLVATAPEQDRPIVADVLSRVFGEKVKALVLI